MGSYLMRTLEQLGEWKMPDGLSLASNTVDIVRQAEAFSLCKIFDTFGDKFSKLSAKD